MVCESNLQVWFNQHDENESRTHKVNFELDGNDGSGKSSGQVPSKIWKNVWNYKYDFNLGSISLKFLFFQDQHHRLNMSHIQMMEHSLPLHQK